MLARRAYAARLRCPLSSNVRRHWKLPNTPTGPMLKDLSPILGVSLVAAGLLLVGCSTVPPPTQPRSAAISSGKCVQPPYPAEARTTGAEGTTTLAFEVDASGKVTRVAILEPSGTSAGHRVLDALALETVRNCLFPPAPGFLPASSKVAYSWRLKD